MKSSSFKSSQWILTSCSILIFTVQQATWVLNLCSISLSACCQWGETVLVICFFCFWMAGKILRKQCQTALPAGFSLPRFSVSNWWWLPSDTWTWLCLRSLSLQWILAAAAMPGFFLSREPPVTPWAMRRLKRCVSSWTAPWQVQTNSGRPIIKAWKHAGEATNPWFTDW